MKYAGSCHCQKVRFEIDTEISEVMTCNCSICAKRGHALHFLPESNFKLLSGQDSLADYQWGKKTIHFHFCSTCGVAPFGKGTMPNGPMVAVNVRCLENVHLDQLKVHQFDGKSLPA